ncbi:hypothetical protein [Acinetobacter lanii]|uniref:Uncharacterized protein n=1 Tax=Acinetobacter lanii TaxID=2715163 RepID=A0A6G8S0S6_9GAMM|nr:hypothetical protein [Acinetobacter lanii]QIO07583.1 hypothetical protein G8D99_00130 [Acinetobacter lanii]
MNQEKQKVIRVLTPTKKTKKVSPIYYGIAGATLGIALTSVLLFSVLGQDAKVEISQTAEQQPNQKHVENVQNNQRNDSVSADRVQQQANESDLNLDENDDNNAHDGFNIPQPKANEINGIFTHKKVEQVKPETQVASNDNPFGALSSQAKVEKPTVAAITKPNNSINKATVIAQKPITNSVLKAQASKSVDAATTKVNQDANKVETAKAQPQPATEKAQPKEKEVEVETPKGTVQISVTRSVKE